MDETAKAAEVERLRERQNNARLTAVLGFGLMFAAYWNVAFAVGGAFTVLGSVAAYIWWGRRIRKVKGDPWDYDPDLDGPRIG